MFVLLGDPALRLPQVADDIAMDHVVTGSSVAVRGTLPDRMRGATVRVSIVRSAASSPLDLEKVPARPGPQRDEAMLTNHRRANRFEVVAERVAAKGTRFGLTLTLPKDLPRGKLRLRVVATTDDEELICVQSLEVIRRKE